MVQQLLILSDIIHTDIRNKPRTDDAGLVVPMARDARR